MSQRTRSNGVIIDGFGSSYAIRIYNPNPVSITVGSNVISAFQTRDIPDIGTLKSKSGQTSTITDFVPGIGSYNAVDHQKVKYNWNANSFEYGPLDMATPAPNPKPFTMWAFGTLSPAMDPSLLQDSDALFGAIDSTAILKARATNQMRPDEPDMGFDLAQFIGELTDFSGFYKAVGQHMLGLRSKLTDMIYRQIVPRRRDKHLRKRGSSWSLSGITEAGVSADLARKLVWQPLIADIHKLRKKLLDLDAAYRRTLNPQTVVVRGKSQSNSYKLNNWTQTNGHVKHACTYTRTKDVVTWALIRRKPLAIPGNAFLRHYLGLYPRASVLWELKSLTFVFDMFADVGKWLRQFESGPVSIPFETLSTGYSVKTVSSIVHQTTLNWPFHHGSALVGATGADFERTSYQRFNAPLEWNNSAIEPLQIGLPNMDQVGTIAELVYMAWNRNSRRD